MGSGVELGILVSQETAVAKHPGSEMVTGSSIHKAMVCVSGLSSEDSPGEGQWKEAKGGSMKKHSKGWNEPNCSLYRAYPAANSSHAGLCHSGKE